MILLIAVIGIIFLTTGIIFNILSDSSPIDLHTNQKKFFCWVHRKDVDDILIAIGIFTIAVALVIGIILGGLYSTSFVIDEKITLYEVENEKIELIVEKAVESYKNYESKFYIDYSTEDLITTIFSYPELKSDELLQQQIELYIDNNNQIKDLQKEKLDCKVLAWWLYFG